MNGDGSRCERDAEAGIGCASTCWCKCKWYYGGNCDSSSQGCENLKDYETNGQCHDENYMLSLAAQAVGTIIGVTLILIIVLPIVLVICICVFICFVCMRRESTIIVNQAAQPTLKTRDIQIQRSMQPGPDGMAGIGIRFACYPGSEPVMVTELTPGQPAALSGEIHLNQQIVKINGQDVRGLEMNQVLGLIKGTPGTMVTLTVMKPSTNQYVPEERYPVSMTSPPGHRIMGGSLVFDNTSSNRFGGGGGVGQPPAGGDFGGGVFGQPQAPRGGLQQQQVPQQAAQQAAQQQMQQQQAQAQVQAQAQLQQMEQARLQQQQQQPQQQQRMIALMEQEMQQAAASMNFENAARLRDAIGVLRRGSTPVPTSQAAAWPQRLSQ
jgi:hypothetical protein